MGAAGSDFAHLLHRVLHEGRSRVVVDLSQVEAIDDSTADGLVAAHEAADRVGGFVRLAAPREAVRARLARPGPRSPVPTFSTVHEAGVEPWTWGDIRLATGTVGASALLVALGLWWPGLAQAAKGRVPGAPPFEVLSLALTELLELAAAALIGVVVAAVVRRLRHDSALQTSMQQAQVLLCVSGAMMMIIIGDSLARAFGIVGAAGIVRFRTPVEDPKDITILFLLMGLGMASGIGALTIAGLGMLFLCVVLVVLHRQLVRELHPGLLVDVTTVGPRPPMAHIAAAFARHGVKADLIEVSPDTSTVVRYRAVLPPLLAPEEVDASLVGDGSHGVSAVSWRAPTRRAEG